MANQSHPSTTLRSGITLNVHDSETIVVKSRRTVAMFDAVGGPEVAGIDQNGNTFGPTEYGEFVIVGLWKHTSRKQWPLSRIEWGCPLRENNNIIEVNTSGKWQPLQRICAITKDELINWNLEFYGKPELPKTWVLNDFGHITCFIAKDINHDGKWNKDSEKIHNQFFHTTPEDEALSFKGKPITLQQSHGCIHVTPPDIDEMINKGYMKKGNMVYIHDYGTKPLGIPTIEAAKPPYSLHFFPGIKKLFIKGD